MATRSLGAKNPFAGFYPSTINRDPLDPLNQPANNALGGMNFGEVQPAQSAAPVAGPPRSPASVVANGMGVGQEAAGPAGPNDVQEILGVVQQALSGVSSAADLTKFLASAGQAGTAAAQLAQLTPELFEYLQATPDAFQALLDGGAMGGGAGYDALAGAGGAGGLGNMLSIPVAGLGRVPILAILKGLLDVGMVAADGSMSDEEKAIQATKAATKMVAAVAAPATFGASLAVTQIWDFVDNMRAGQTVDEALVRANDPTALVDFEGGGLANRLYAPSKSWQSFPERLGQTMNLSGDALKAVVQGLPYVQSQAELSDVLAQFKSDLSNRIGGFGEGSGKFQIPYIPGMTSDTHGIETTPFDFSPHVAEAQRMIDTLLARLPATTQGGMGVGDALMRNYNQFLQANTTKQQYSPQGIAPQQYFSKMQGPDLYPEISNQAGHQYLDDPTMEAGVAPRQVLYGQPGYNYKTAGLPAPGKTFGAPSTYWEELTSGKPLTDEERTRRAEQLAAIATQSYADAFTDSGASAEPAGVNSPASASAAAVAPFASTPGAGGAGGELNTAGGDAGGAAGSAAGGDSGSGGGGGDGGSGGGDGGGGPGGDGGNYRTGGLVRKRAQRPDPHRLSQLLQQGAKVTAGNPRSRTDDVRSVDLQHGEFVIDRDSTRVFEPLLRAINSLEPRQGGMSVGRRPQPGDGFQARPSARGGFFVTGRPRAERR